MGICQTVMGCAGLISTASQGAALGTSCPFSSPLTWEKPGAFFFFFSAPYEAGVCPKRS